MTTTSAHDVWHQAFLALLGDEGRGAQARVARATGMTDCHINDVVKGRRRASQDLQEAIAKAFGLTFIEMLQRPPSDPPKA